MNVENIDTELLQTISSDQAWHYRIFPKENRDLHIQAQEKDHGRYSIYIVSRDDKGINAHARDLEWEVHAEAVLRLEQRSDQHLEPQPLIPENLIDSFAKRLL